jgi:hypothetical protein
LASYLIGSFSRYKRENFWKQKTCFVGNAKKQKEIFLRSLTDLSSGPKCVFLTSEFSSFYNDKQLIYIGGFVKQTSSFYIFGIAAHATIG